MSIAVIFGTYLSVFGALIQVFAFSGGAKADAELAIPRYDYNIDVAIDRGKQRAHAMLSALLVISGVFLTISSGSSILQLGSSDCLVLFIGFSAITYFILVALYFLRHHHVRKSVIAMYRLAYEGSDRIAQLRHELEDDGIELVRRALDSRDLVSDDFFELFNRNS